MDRRDLLRNAGMLSMGALTVGSDVLKLVEERYLNSTSGPLDQFAGNDTSEDYWHAIRQAYTVSPQIINLNNGGVAPQPKVVQDAMVYYNMLSNEAPSYYMWRTLDQGREPLREKMALVAGCSPEEIAFNRNSSEALETIIYGLRLKAGDEVVLSKQDYPNMINAWKQREEREGIILKWVNFEFPIENDETIVNTYANAFTSKTKIVHVTHMINWNGQLLPAKKIADVAHARNIEVLLDAAHSFSHIPYRIDELGCDYFGTSLHKWLSAPFGTGLLFVKKDKIKNLYPLFGAANPNSDDIRKYEALGTRSFPTEFAVGHALDFFTAIGAQRKFDRLFSLKEYWTKQALQHPKIKIHSPLSKAYSGAIAIVGIEGKTPGEVSEYLLEKGKIHSVAIDWENIHGVRITPNVYTMKTELDKLVKYLVACADTKSTQAVK